MAKVPLAQLQLLHESLALSQVPLDSRLGVSLFFDLNVELFDSVSASQQEQVALLLIHAALHSVPRTP